MGYRAALLLLLQILQKVEGSAFSPNCLPGQNTDDEMSYSEVPGRFDITCTRQFVELYCCVQGYKSLVWYKNEEHGWKEIQPNPLIYYPSNDNNQTLTFRSPLFPYDQGQYACVAEDGKGNLLNNTFDLEIRECEGSSQLPVAILPTEEAMERPLNSDATIKCVGFFGKGLRNSLSDTFWIMTRYNETGHTIREFWMPKYGLMTPTASNINITYETTATHIKSSVIITNITKDNFANYTCQLTNIHGNVLKTVELLETVEVDEEKIIEQIGRAWRFAFLAVVIFLCLVILAGSIVYSFRLDIKLFVRDRFTKDHPDGKEYDAFVVFKNDIINERRFVNKGILRVLEKQYGYKLFIAERDFPLGDAEANAYTEGIRKCRSVVFLVSPESLREQWMDFVFHMTATKSDIFYVFLIYREVKDSDWHSHQEGFEKAFKLAKRKVFWPEQEPSCPKVPVSNSSSSYTTMSKKEVKFWKEFRWALHKPLSLAKSQSSSVSSSLATNGLKSQSSTSSQTLLTESDGTKKSPPYAFSVI